MNYYNPYYYVLPANNGLFGNILKGGINWSGILNGTQRTLNLVNQAIPLVKQASPMIKNAKTMFKVMNEFKKIDSPKEKNNEFKKIDSLKEKNNESKKETVISNNGPTFFI